MNKRNASIKLRTLSFKLGASLLGLCVVTPAWAECAPDAVPEGGTIVCSGTDADGVTVISPNASLEVASGAEVDRVVSTNKDAAGNGPTNGVLNMQVNGQITNGLLVRGVSSTGNFPPVPFVEGQTTNVTIGQNGKILGAKPIELVSVNNFLFGGFGGPFITVVNVTNSGEIRTTTGNAPAISHSSTQMGSFVNVQNEQSGFIGGIAGNFGTIVNHGLIDGGANAAILRSIAPTANAGYVDNFGTIKSASTDATISLGFRSEQVQIVNNGSIANVGGGFAIYGGLITNKGTISTNGNVAISGLQGVTLRNSGVVSATQTALKASGFIDVINSGSINGGIEAREVFLDNSGTINGNVTALTKASLINRGTINGNIAVPITIPFQISGVYLLGGVVNGNVILGAGDDTLTIRVGANGIASSVTGTIDGGAGFDQFNYAFLSGETDVTSLAAPTNFESVALQIAGNSTVNLVNGFALSNTLVVETFYSPTGISSVNTVHNKANVSLNDTAFLIKSFGFGSNNLTFINSGQILTNLTSGKFAVEAQGNPVIENRGTITAIGGGGVKTYPNDLFSKNSGSIVADETGWDGLIVSNSGSIRSNQGTGVLAFEFQNSGEVYGALVGASRFQKLTNSGSIRSDGVGLLISPTNSIYDPNTFIDNLAGGIITGGAAAIKAEFSPYFPYAGATVRNAGQINGLVDLRNPDPNFAFTKNTFVAFAGSRLNGNLILGDSSYDRIIVRYGDTGPLAGVTGTISGAQGSTLQYVVDQNRSIPISTLANIPAFLSNVAYLLVDKNVTLTGNGTVNRTLQFGGWGNARLTGSLTNNGLQPLIAVGTTGIINPYSTNPDRVNKIIVTNSGTITGIHSDATKPATAMITAFDDLLYNAETATFINAGTINVRDNALYDAQNPLIGIAGQRIVNDGLINVGGGVGIQSFGKVEFRSETSGLLPTVINKGIIKQLSGAAPGIGIWNFGDTENSGIISVAGPAVLMGDYPGLDYLRWGGALYNYGLLESTGGPAIVTLQSGAIYNEKTGIIRSKAGSPAGLSKSGLSVTNAGLIFGDLAVSTEADAYGNLPALGYTSNGGTLFGSLRYGDGNDSLYWNGGVVTGSIDAAGGYDQFQVVVAKLGSKTLDLNRFRNFEVVALEGPGSIKLSGPLQFDILFNGGSSLTIDSGQNVRLTGTFEQQAGQTKLDGRIEAPNFYIFNGILSGNGRVVSDNFALSGGYLAPGGDGKIGTFTVAGRALVDGAFTTVFDIGSSSNDRLNVIASTDQVGSIELFGTTLILNPVGGGPRHGQNYRIINASGGVAGEFGSVVGQVGVLTPIVTYNPTNVTVRYNAGSLAAALPIGSTPQAIAFANALDALRGSGYANLADLYGAVDLMDAARLGVSLAELNPTIVGKTRNFGIGQLSDANQLLTNRIATLGAGGIGDGKLALIGQSNFAGDGLDKGDAGKKSLPENVSGFMAMQYGNGRTNSVSPRFGATGRPIWNIAMGLEIAMNDATAVGSAFAYSRGETRLAGDPAAVRTVQAYGYITHNLSDKLYLGGLAGFARSEANAALGEQNSAFSAQNVRARMSAMAIEANAGASLQLSDRFQLMQQVAIRFESNNLGGLTNTGQVTSLRIDRFANQRLETRVGTKLQGKTALGNGWQLSTQLQADRVQSLWSQDDGAKVRFAAAPQLAFTVPFGPRDTSWTSASGSISLEHGRVKFSGGLSSDMGRSDYDDERAFMSFSWAF